MERQSAPAVQSRASGVSSADLGQAAAWRRFPHWQQSRQTLYTNAIFQHTVVEAIKLVLQRRRRFTFSAFEKWGIRHTGDTFQRRLHGHLCQGCLFRFLHACGTSGLGGQL